MEVPPCEGDGGKDDDGDDGLEETTGYFLEGIEAHNDEQQNDDVM